MFATLLREGRICDRRTKTYPITSTVGTRPAFSTRGSDTSVLTLETLRYDGPTSERNNIIALAPVPRCEPLWESGLTPRTEHRMQLHLSWLRVMNQRGSNNLYAG